LKLWSLPTGQEVAPLRARGPVAFTPDGRRLVSGGPAGKGTVTVWDIASSPGRRRLETGRVVQSLAFTPGGSVLATGGPGAVRVWDVAAGQYRAVLDSNKFFQYRPVAFSPDGKTLAVGRQSMGEGAALSRATVLLFDA